MNSPESSDAFQNQFDQVPMAKQTTNGDFSMDPSNPFDPTVLCPEMTEQQVPQNYDTQNPFGTSVDQPSQQVSGPADMLIDFEGKESPKPNVVPGMQRFNPFEESNEPDSSNLFVSDINPPVDTGSDQPMEHDISPCEDSSLTSDSNTAEALSQKPDLLMMTESGDIESRVEQSSQFGAPDSDIETNPSSYDQSLSNVKAEYENDEDIKGDSDREDYNPDVIQNNAQNVPENIPQEEITAPYERKVSHDEQIVPGVCSCTEPEPQSSGSDEEDVEAEASVPVEQRRTPEIRLQSEENGFMDTPQNLNVEEGGDGDMDYGESDDDELTPSENLNKSGEREMMVMSDPGTRPGDHEDYSDDEEGVEIYTDEECYSDEDYDDGEERGYRGSEEREGSYEDGERGYRGSEEREGSYEERDQEYRSSEEREGQNEREYKGSREQGFEGEGQGESEEREGSYDYVGSEEGVPRSSSEREVSPEILSSKEASPEIVDSIKNEGADGKEGLDHLVDEDKQAEVLECSVACDNLEMAPEFGLEEMVHENIVCDTESVPTEVPAVVEDKILNVENVQDESAILSGDVKEAPGDGSFDYNQGDQISSSQPNVDEQSMAPNSSHDVDEQVMVPDSINDLTEVQAQNIEVSDDKENDVVPGEVIGQHEHAATGPDAAQSQVDYLSEEGLESSNVEDTAASSDRQTLDEDTPCKTPEDIADTSEELMDTSKGFELEMGVELDQNMTQEMDEGQMSELGKDMDSVGVENEGMGEDLGDKVVEGDKFVDLNVGDVSEPNVDLRQTEYGAEDSVNQGSYDGDTNDTDQGQIQGDYSAAKVSGQHDDIVEDQGESVVAVDDASFVKTEVEKDEGVEGVISESEIVSSEVDKVESLYEHSHPFPVTPQGVPPPITPEDHIGDEMLPGADQPGDDLLSGVVGKKVESDILENGSIDHPLVTNGDIGVGAQIADDTIRDDIDEEVSNLQQTKETLTKKDSVVIESEGSDMEERSITPDPDHLLHLHKQHIQDHRTEEVEEHYEKREEHEEYHMESQEIQESAGHDIMSGSMHESIHLEDGQGIEDLNVHVGKESGAMEGSFILEEGQTVEDIPQDAMSGSMMGGSMIMDEGQGIDNLQNDHDQDGEHSDESPNAEIPAIMTRSAMEDSIILGEGQTFEDHVVPDQMTGSVMESSIILDEGETFEDQQYQGEEADDPSTAECQQPSYEMNPMTGSMILSEGEKLEDAYPQDDQSSSAMEGSMVVEEGESIEDRLAVDQTKMSASFSESYSESQPDDNLHDHSEQDREDIGVEDELPTGPSEKAYTDEESRFQREAAQNMVENVLNDAIDKVETMERSTQEEEEKVVSDKQQTEEQKKEPSAPTEKVIEKTKTEKTDSEKKEEIIKTKTVKESRIGRVKTKTEKERKNESVVSKESKIIKEKTTEVKKEKPKATTTRTSGSDVFSRLYQDSSKRIERSRKTPEKPEPETKIPSPTKAEMQKRSMSATRHARRPERSAGDRAGEFEKKESRSKSTPRPYTAPVVRRIETGGSTPRASRPTQLNRPKKG